MQPQRRHQLLLSISALLFWACGGSSEQAPPPNNQQAAMYPQQPGAYPQQPGAYPQQPGAYPQQPGAYPQQPGAYPQQPAAYPQQPAAAQPAPQPAAPASPPAAAPGSPAQRVDVSMAAAVQPLIQQLGKTQAVPGAKPSGNLIVGNFAQGQVLEETIQLGANKTYTVVAVGGPGVAEVNLKFLPPVVSMIIAQDQGTGPQAVLGPNPGWKAGPISAPMRLIIEVPQGQGLVAAQVYEK